MFTRILINPTLTLWSVVPQGKSNRADWVWFLLWNFYKYINLGFKSNVYFIDNTNSLKLGRILEEWATFHNLGTWQKLLWNDMVRGAKVYSINWDILSVNNDLLRFFEILNLTNMEYMNLNSSFHGIRNYTLTNQTLHLRYMLVLNLLPSTHS